ncbi:AAA family ATPase [Mesorhizobium sp. B2-8-3]|uniref:AAA family ATPase n=1 Tax=Mesorhizobium sp. B2-8-3 TaxID=2589905 RepID=UPI00112AC541|nr:AAA family ATPase [Mesorhizobium sp. B2-8-3]TPJ27427.1 helix-turn-helix transcriptional regulator [Mesorhizobium sp. B2-8-3]
MNDLHSPIYRFAGFALDLGNGLLRGEEGEVALRPKSMELLGYLIRNAGRVVPKNELMNSAWPDVTVTEDSLTQCISDIRRSLGDKEQKLIRTVPRRGYLFTEEVLHVEIGRRRELTEGELPLAERQTQLDQLHRLLSDAAQKRGRVIALLGESGAGKTSLVEAFAASVASHTRILRSSCENLSVPDPLGPLHDLAREAGWTIPSGTGQRLVIFSRALEVFDTGPQPTLLVVEDVHWADDATLDFIRFFGRRIRSTGALLLLTVRNDDSEGQRRLRRALSDIPVNNVVRIDVPLLTEAGVAALANKLGQNGQSIYLATGGNAFFVTELLRAGPSQTLPPSVSDAVLARAEHLSPKARTLLDVVSVFPRSADVEIMEEICGPGTLGLLVECVAAGILLQIGEDYPFRHDIARRAIELALPPPVKRGLNFRVLTALKAIGNASMARLVHHAVEAHDLKATREFAPRAAEQAARLGAHHEAVGHYQTALQQADAFNPEQRAEIYDKYAFECHLVGRINDAIEACQKARSLHQAKMDVLKEGDSLRWLSRYSYLLGEREAAEEHGAKAIALLSTRPPGSELAMALSNLSQLSMLADRVDDTLRHGEEAISLAERLGRPDIACHALNNIGTVERWVNADGARQELDHSLEIALDQDLPEEAARAFINRACVDIDLLRLPEARTFLDRGIEYCLERELDTWVNYMRGWLAELLVRQGQWDEAAELALPVVNSENATPFVRHPAMVALARVWTRRGDSSSVPLIARLRQHLDKGLELQRFAPYAILQAERAWLGQVDAGEALYFLERAEAMMPSRAIHGELFFWQQMIFGKKIADASDMAPAYCAYFAGNWRRAADMWSDIGLPFERALALLGGDGSAQREALTIFEALGARPFTELVRNRMRTA